MIMYDSMTQVTMTMYDSMTIMTQVNDYVRQYDTGHNDYGSMTQVTMIMYDSMTQVNDYVWEYDQYDTGHNDYVWQYDQYDTDHNNYLLPSWLEENVEEGRELVKSQWVTLVHINSYHPGWRSSCGRRVPGNTRNWWSDALH